MFEAPDIPGAEEVIAWFGYWPTFHDAEVLSMTLERANASQVVIHAWKITPEIDSRGYYVLAKHALVTFFLEGFPLDEHGVTNVHLAYFNHQNVLSSASVNKIALGYELVLEGIFGVDGVISAERMRVKLEPKSLSPMPAEPG